MSPGSVCCYFNYNTSLSLVKFVCCPAVTFVILMIMYHYSDLKSMCEMKNHEVHNMVTFFQLHLKGSLSADPALGDTHGISRSL